ncbi:MAG: InlB B-repeat-containing protein, partial [Oscillospiraceae bacterium]|nr:InlB B-repeat-containing protein [Oscillospiraceae bacterium]
MTKRIRSLLAMLLAIVMIVGLLPTVALAREAEPAVEPEATDLPQANGMQVHTPYGLKLGSGKQATRGENRDLPKSFNSVNEGWITSVKNQTQYGQYGTCWAFGTMAPIEAYMIKNEMQVGSTGETATTDLDLSEYHLSYFNYSNSYDEHNLTSGDSSILDGESHVNVGGDGYKATLTMMRWIGAASEAESALAYSECSETSTIDPKYAYAYDVGHVTSVDWIEPTDMDTIKQYIMEYGAGFFGYYYNTSYEGINGAYCYMNTSESDDYGPNHGVTVVGWDDDYSKSNFTGRSTPTANGAWIIKNSWGNNSHTVGGYNYISYEDTSYLGHPIMFFTVDSLNTYNHLYQYDGTCFTGDATKGWIPLTQNNSLISNVFTAAGKEMVEAFSICTLEEDLGYTLQVYKNPTNLTGSNPNPASGTPMSTQTGTIAHAGYHTIRIAAPFKVEAGDTFSAVFTLESQQGGQNFQMVIPCDETQTEDYTENGVKLATLIHTHVSHPGTSFFRLRDNSAWSQLDNGKSLRIKAYTTDAPFDLTVEAGAHGSAALGTYTAGVGYLVTAAPDSGYYASGYTVVSGAANVMQNGNSFYVNPTENTVIRINFSQQEPFTLTYKANGETFGSPVTGMTGDAVALPAGAAAFEGYTFLGWATSEVPDAVTGKPLCLEPGATYYPNGGSTTLYALYSFRALAVPGLDGSYEKITSTADLTEGSYLIVNEASLHALDGSKADSSGMWSKINTAPNYVDVTFNGDRIPDNETLRSADFNYDPSVRQFYSAYGYPIGGYKNNYYFYVWGSSSTSAAQTVSFDASGNAVIQDDYYGNKLYYTNASTSYFAYQSSAANPVQLYRKTEDTTTTYYSTAVNASPVTAWTVSFNANGGSVVASQTVVDGQTAVRPADPTKTGFTFGGWYSDSALTNAYDFTQPVTANLTLYAKWVEDTTVTYTVTFQSNGGSAVAAQTVTEGEAAVRPADPTRTGFTFGGWYTDSNLTNAYDFSQPVTADLILYAKWTEIVVENVTLTYLVNGAAVNTVTVAAGTGVTLPASATAFDGWTFIGWASAATEETAVAPAYYAPGDSYTVNANASLYALYTRTEGTGGSAYELVTANLSDWTGSYVITKGNAPTYVMAGLDTDKSYETESNGGAASFASTGITLEGTQLKNVAQIYSFTVAPIEGTTYFSFQNAEKGSYLLIRNSTLYAGSFNSSNSRWSINVGSNGDATIQNPYSSYSNCITFAGSSFWGNIFQVMSSASDIYLWKETASGVTYYTTIIGEEHVHTPAAPVIENEVPATCTTAGSYDSVVYCSECGEEISRETVTVPALGHTAGTAVKENEVA